MPLTGAEVTGKEEVARAFDHIAEKAASARQVAEELSAIGLDASRSLAPVGATGELLGGLQAVVGENSAEIGSTTGYAPFVEFGTVYMPGVRFLVAGYEAMHARGEATATAWMDGILGEADRMG